jgi:hypothetical protein
MYSTFIVIYLFNYLVLFFVIYSLFGIKNNEKT